MRLPYIITYIVFLLVHAHTYADRKYADSLLQTMPYVNDTLKVLKYYEIINHWDYHDFEKKIEFAKNALNLSTKNRYLYGEGLMYRILGNIYFIQKDYIQSVEYLYKALDIFNKIKKEEEGILVLSDISRTYTHFKKNENARLYQNRAIKKLEKSKSLNIKLETINHLIASMLDTHDYDTIAEFIEKYYRHFELGNPKHISLKLSFHNRLTKYYLDVNKPEMAKVEAFKVWKYYQNIGKISDVGNYIWCLNNIGNIYTHFKSLDSAIYYYNLSLKYAKPANQDIWKAINYRDISQVYFLKNDLDKSIFWANKYLNISKNRFYADDIKQAHLHLADYYVAKKDYFNAFNHILDYSKLADSLLKNENSLILKTLIFQKDLLEAEKMNQQLSLENTEKDKIIKDKRILQTGLTVVTLLIFIFSIFLIYLFVQYRINNRLLQHKTQEIIHNNEQLENQNALLEKLNEEKNGLLGIVSHDLKAPLNRIEGLLNFISTEADNMTSNQNLYLQLAQKELTNCKDLIKRILDSELQNKHSSHLNIENIEINHFLNNIIQQYQIIGANKNISIHSHLPEQHVNVRTDKGHLSRILDNLVSNAIKFSNQGSEVEVAVEDTDKHVAIKIRDNGPGFTEEDKKKMFKKYQKLSAVPTAGENSTGLGLHIVKRLADELGVGVDLQSQENKGSTFTITLKKEAPQNAG